ncbi:saccharopine dehydrogenase [Zooshikella harenae]|uniref:Saccharopine dehydrogenase [NAD(+), L-lysine-forming] n=1 Tax=Zooshikella harenae TaxID=2827238 RepID=A0ABS5ZBS1_9GAMM|nr:saccharopine dehydrogenase [Zooshikella harenae]MBU2711506.1 saccharopine dehydrogenase [Zooshikella harenae]
MIRICLRAETKKFEKRSPLSPESAKTLIDRGFHIYVEESKERCFDIDCFRSVGCSIIPSDAWIDLPSDFYILGLKELPETLSKLKHKHIYFGHAFKEQVGWKKLLEKYKRGGGSLIDMEFLTSSEGRRVAAFGYWAGYCGAALAVMNWCKQQLNDRGFLSFIYSFKNRDTLSEELNKQYALARKRTASIPSVVVIGYKGRCGTGATDLLSQLGITPVLWDIEDTKGKGPLIETLGQNILINCSLVMPDTEPFLLPEHVNTLDRKLSVICDVSCDPTSPYNPLPIYSKTTTFNNPIQSLSKNDNLLDLIAIDHLPSLLPLESSLDFSDQLLGTLLQLGQNDCYELNAAISKFHAVLAMLE